MKKRVKTTALLLSACMLSSLLWPAQTAEASDEGNTVVINEIESDDADGGNDWVEIINLGESDVNISGWFVTDDKGLERLDAGETWGLSEGTVLKAGEVLVLEDSIDFDLAWAGKIR